MSERKPLSLNERANRLLLDLSSSCPSKPPPPPPEESKTHKVLIEGRRRLYRLSAPAEDDSSEEGKGVDESLFDSPPSSSMITTERGEQIRDILTDLTARLECLSVERPKEKAAVVEVQEEDEFGSAKSTLSRRGCQASSEEACRGASVVVENVDDEGVASSRSVGGGVVVVLSDDESDVEIEGEPIELSGFGSCERLMFRLPARVANILYPHQRDGLRWLWSLHCGMTGGILGDDMGLGKTMQISSYLAGLFHSKLIKRAMIVAPKTLLPHWIKELTAVGLSEKIKDYFGMNAKIRNFKLDNVLQAGGVLLTTYDIVRNNFKWMRGDFFSRRDGVEDEITWDYVILDEGHIIKNPSTQRAKSLLEIPSSHRIILSGTPIQNNLKELWALFNFCCPDILGDKNEFKERYEYKILRGNDKNATDREKYVGSSVAKELRERIKPYFLRRLKSDVFSESDTTKDAKLSRKTELIIWLRLTLCQRKLYEAFLNSELALLSINGSPLAALTILKKICDHPLLLTRRAAEEVLDGMDTMLNRDDIGMVEDMAKSLANMTHLGEDYQKNESSCKISFILSLLENLVSGGHNVLIFSQTRKMLNFIQEVVSQEGYEFMRIDGTTKMPDREKIVGDFQAGRAPILLLTSRVGGLGLTLTNADRVIVVDPAWNPSVDNQSVDRAYRIGQKKDVVVYRLMTCGTIEEKIYKMQVFKGGLFKVATEQKEQTRYFSQRDLQELFSLPNQGFDVSLTQQQLHEEHGRHCKIDDYLVQHITFLEKQGIAGVSHHSLLFSKTATEPVVEDEEEQSWKGNPIIRKWPSISTSERPTLATKFTINPKLVKTHFRMTHGGASPNEVEDKRKEIQNMITRLSGTLSNNAVVSKLPDKGDRIIKRIAELNKKLQEIRESTHEQETSKETKVEIDGDVADELRKGFTHLNI